MLATAVSEVARNIVRFAGSGEMVVELVESPRRGVRCIARDTGPGIAPQDQKRIFEDFQQVDNSSTRYKGGTGLGLAISRRFVEMHGGSLTVESALGAGSTFHLSIPMRVAKERVEA